MKAGGGGGRGEGGGRDAEECGDDSTFSWTALGLLACLLDASIGSAGYAGSGLADAVTVDPCGSAAEPLLR